MNKLKKIWKDPVGSKLIAAAIIGLASPIFIYGWSIIRPISFKNTFVKIAKFLETPIVLPLWSLISFLLLILFTVTLLKTIQAKKEFKRSLMSDEEKPERVSNQSNEEEQSKFDTKEIQSNLENTNKSESVVTKAATVFFYERICDSFPGVETLKWFEDPYEAIERLSLLLAPPVSFENSKGHGTSCQPMWWFRGLSALHIEQFKRIDGTHCLIGHYLYNIKRIAVIRIGSYYQNFVYIETNPDKPTGLYKRPIKEYSTDENSNILREEYGLFNNFPISRQEYDDGVSEINGQIVKTHDAELQVRYLSAYNFIISSQFSPYNSNDFCRKSEGYFNKLLIGNAEEKFPDFLKFMINLPRNKYDK